MNCVEENITFKTDGLTLEGRLAYPEDPAPATTVCLLAPHPHFGGNLDNNVIRHLATNFAQRGAATLRFNYRGVGASQLNLPQGTTPYAWFEAMETNRTYDALIPDVVAAMAFLDNAAPNAGKRILLGYSFGSILAGMAAPQTNATAIVAVSPPVTRVALTAYRDCALPKTFLAGDKDFVFDQEIFTTEFAALPQPKQWIPMPGCDHFFRGEEKRLANTIAETLP